MNFITNKTKSLGILILSLLLIITASFGFFFSDKNSIKISPSTERELKVNIEAGMAKIFVSGGASPNILSAKSDVNNIKHCIDYSIRDDVGYISIDTDCKSHGKNESKKSRYSFKSPEWHFEFIDALPISFDIELGVGKAELDLTTLRVKDLNISTGASSVLLQWNKPNKNVLEEISIEAGLSKFTAEGLSWANFNHLKFQGGVGSYRLDFSGELSKEVDVDIEIGLGSIILEIPEDIGVRVQYEESFLSNFSIDNEFDEEEENVYYSPNYRKSRGKMNINIETGLGNIKVKRINR